MTITRSRRKHPVSSRTWSNKKEIRQSDKERAKNWRRSRKGGKNAVRGYESNDRSNDSRSGRER